MTGIDLVSMMFVACLAIVALANVGDALGNVRHAIKATRKWWRKRERRATQ